MPVCLRADVVTRLTRTIIIITLVYSARRTVVKSSLAVDDIEIDELYFRISPVHTYTDAHALGQRDSIT